MLTDNNYFVLCAPIEWYKIWPSTRAYTTMSIRAVLEDNSRVYIDIPLDTDKIESNQVQYITKYLDQPGATPLIITGMAVNKNKKDGSTVTAFKTALSKIGIPTEFKPVNNIYVSGKVDSINNQLIKVSTQYRDVSTNQYKSRIVPVLSSAYPNGIQVGSKVYITGHISSNIGSDKEYNHVRTNEQLVTLMR